MLGSVSKVIFFLCGFCKIDIFCKMDKYKMLSVVPGELRAQGCSWAVSLCSKAVNSLSTTVSTPQSGEISKVKKLSYSHLKTCTVKDSCGCVSSTDALSCCLGLSFLPQPGVKPTCQNNTAEPHGPPDASGWPCCRKQSTLFLEMEMVSLCSAEKFFGSYPSLNS